VFHPLITDFAKRRRIELPNQQGGRLTVVVDDEYRVHLQSTPDGGVVLLSKLASLPPLGRTREMLLLGLGEIAAGTLAGGSAACVIDEHEAAVWLQQLIVQASVTSLEEPFGDFVNTLSFLKSALLRIR
jgi:hypothetical protein